jgi:hypothetical protein
MSFDVEWNRHRLVWQHNSGDDQGHAGPLCRRAMGLWKAARDLRLDRETPQEI